MPLFLLIYFVNFILLHVLICFYFSFPLYCSVMISLLLLLLPSLSFIYFCFFFLFLIKQLLFPHGTVKFRRLLFINHNHITCLQSPKSLHCIYFYFNIILHFILIFTLLFCHSFYHEFILTDFTAVTSEQNVFVAF